ncbi:MAG: GNAT family N-acetyltransferase [Peptococcaceae bacterium]|nr:GNAT family N-acetyltransferase [Candidatus Syntrophopropionicum ammoniitolerans]
MEKWYEIITINTREACRMLTGVHVYLRLMEEKDVMCKVKWINDPEVRKTLNFIYPISEIATKQWLNRVASDTSRKDFIVCLKENDKQIGYAGLLNIDIRNSKAESYMGIGEKDYWGKGYAKEIRKILLEYVFLELALNKVYSYVWTKNEKVINLNKAFGFKIEGNLKQDVFSHGEYRDRLLMSLFKSDYLSNRS